MTVPPGRSQEWGLRGIQWEMFKDVPRPPSLVEAEAGNEQTAPGGDLQLGDTVLPLTGCAITRGLHLLSVR